MTGRLTTDSTDAGDRHNVREFGDVGQEAADFDSGLMPVAGAGSP
jgi:hypothetical protein